MDFAIRVARADELDEVGELTADAYLAGGLLAFGEEDPYLPQLRDARRRAAHAQVLVAVDAGDAQEALLGAVTYVGEGGEYADLAGPGEAEFRMLAVRAGARGRGVGEALTRECLARAARAGLQRMVLCSDPKMLAAHRLYGRLGFVREPARDWEAMPGLPLWTFTRSLP